MKFNRSLLLLMLFGVMMLLLHVNAHAQYDDDMYFDPEFDDVEYSEDYVDEDFGADDYNYLSDDASLEIRRVRRFRNTFNFVVIIHDAPWGYYNPWNYYRPYRPYRCFRRYNNWRRHHWHYAHHYHNHYGHHGWNHHHWNHWAHHGHHYSPYGGYYGGHHYSHYDPWGWHYRKGETSNTGRKEVGLVAHNNSISTGRSIGSNGKSTSNALSQNTDKGGRTKANNEVISIGKPKATSTSGRTPAASNATLVQTGKNVQSDNSATDRYSDSRSKTNRADVKAPSRPTTKTTTTTRNTTSRSPKPAMQQNRPRSTSKSTTTRSSRPKTSSKPKSSSKPRSTSRSSSSSSKRSSSSKSRSSSRPR